LVPDGIAVSQFRHLQKQQKQHSSACGTAENDSAPQKYGGEEQWAGRGPANDG
jgi:hypothetical protein